MSANKSTILAVVVGAAIGAVSIIITQAWFTDTENQVTANSDNKPLY